MDIDFSNVKSLKIPEGNVIEIKDSKGNIIWTKPNDLYPPMIEMITGETFYIIDNPLNEDRVVSYNIYEEDGTFVRNVLKTSDKMEEKINYVGDFKIKAVDFYGNMSDFSDAFHITCFVAGTAVLMADNSFKVIEEIQVGEKVKSFNFKNNAYCVGEVTKVATGYTNKLAMVTFDNYEYVVMSQGHPLFTRDGWHSITNKDGYSTLVVGDEVLCGEKYRKIIDIQLIDTEPIMVYSLGVTVSNGKEKYDGTYFAGMGMTMAIHCGGSHD